MQNNPEQPVVIVAGMGRTSRAIGKENGLLWHVPDDMKRFKTLTLGHPVIMGRKTFESILDILGKPLPERTTIVVTRKHDYEVPAGVKVATSFEDALLQAKAEGPTEIHIGGGEEIYKQALPYAQKLYITYFDDEKEGDTHFPAFEQDFVVTKEHEPREHNGVSYQWIDYERA